MKLLALAIALSFSTAISAKTTATEGFKNLLYSGYFLNMEEPSCSVIIKIKEDTVDISINKDQVKNSMTLDNSSSNYEIDDERQEIAAEESLNWPKYLNGGTKVLNIKKSSSKANYYDVYFSNILIDHRDNDFSTYLSCSIYVKPKAVK